MYIKLKNKIKFLINVQARDGFLDSVENVNILKDVVEGPLKNGRRYDVFYMNGYRFHTIYHSSKKKSIEKSEVYVKFDDNSPNEIDFYGKLKDILSLNIMRFQLKGSHCSNVNGMIILPLDMAMVCESIHGISWLMLILVDHIESTILLYWQVKLLEFIIYII